MVSDLPDWRRLIVDGGLGLACDPADPAVIAAVLGRLAADPAGTRAMGEVGRRRVLAEWNYESQFEPVKRLLEGDRG